jgi:hypothetical protein
MKIELRKLKIALHMSEETTAFTADIYVDGKEAGYAKNNGHGECTFYHAYEGKRSLIEAAEKHCLALPAQTYDMGGGRDPFVMKMNLEHFIDQLVEDELKKKDRKKLEKKMVNHIMWGKPNGTSYIQVKFPRPISEYPLPALQKAIDTYKKDFKEGDVFLNTNLEALGVKL